DRLGKGFEVQPQAEVPDDAGLVVGIEQVVQGQGREDLLTIRLTQTRGRSVAHDPHRCCWMPTPLTYELTFDSHALSSPPSSRTGPPAAPTHAPPASVPRSACRPGPPPAAPPGPGPPPPPGAAAPSGTPPRRAARRPGRAGPRSRPRRPPAPGRPTTIPGHAR